MGTLPTEQASSPADAQTGWRAGTAWSCILVLVMLSFSMNTLLRFLSRSSPATQQWLATPFGRSALDVLRAGCGLAVVFLLSGGGSVGAFSSRAGLTRWPSLAGWFAAWLGAAIGLLELYFVTKGWEPQNTSAARLRSSGGGLWFSYLISTLVIAPFYEETVMRGFLYRAFRSSYTVPASAFCVVLVVGYFHWGLLAQPLFFADLVVGAGVLCLIRERTGSTWNCTLFHAAHNASASVRWPFYLGGMLLVLPLCLRSKGTSSRVSQSP